MNHNFIQTECESDSKINIVEMYCIVQKMYVYTLPHLNGHIDWNLIKERLKFYCCFSVLHHTRNKKYNHHSNLKIYDKYHLV